MKISIPKYSFDILLQMSLIACTLLASELVSNTVVSSRKVKQSCLFTDKNANLDPTFNTLKFPRLVRVFRKMFEASKVVIQ